jgi:D-tagatose 6-phosphate 4-epimerase
MDSATDLLFALPARHDRGERAGLTSVCSAHPMVIEAALAEAGDSVACIEATCNQVNQDGGYTGMTPADFRAFVLGIAAEGGFPANRILFGGDHLGPNPWRSLPAAQAMEKAVTMTHAYAAAGFAKLHLDASMSCAGDPLPLPPSIVAERAARLAQAAEAGAKEGGHKAPGYIVGTEVPVPGGAAEALDALHITTPADAAETLALHRAAFAARAVGAAFDRVIALVVQPGVEFGHSDVVPFAPEAAAPLTLWRDQTGGVVFEAHSTDYQSAPALAALVRGGFAILKVGPGLTFALREALYGLDQITGQLAPEYVAGSLPLTMERLMLDRPADWAAYCHGTPHDAYLQRHFSYSDRIRYYWNQPKARAAVAAMFVALQGRALPVTLISQYLPRLSADVAAGRLGPDARGLALAAVRAALAPYSAATAPGGR